MTEKDLKKLSRLELLELLLAESKEIEMLKSNADTAQKVEISEVTIEPGSLKRIERVANETNSVVMNIYKLLTDMNETQGSITTKKESDPEINQDYPVAPTKKKITDKSDGSTDRQLFNRLMFYFAQNAYLLDYFPKDIQQELVVKIDEIFKSKK